VEATCVRMHVKGTTLSVTDCGVQDCGSWRIPHYLDNQLTDGGEDAGLKGRPSFTPK
jgi:hypothetical protein